MASEEQAEVARSGWLRKKGSRGSTWGDRYFVLKGRVLSYYLKPSDMEPRGSLLVTQACRISEIRSDMHKKKKQFIFRIVWPAESGDDDDDNTSIVDGEDGAVTPSGAPKERKGFFRNRHPSKDASKHVDKEDKNGNGKAAAATAGGLVAGAMTAGVGLLAGMMYSGMSGAHKFDHTFSDPIGSKDKSVVLACEMYSDAEAWIHAIYDAAHVAVVTKPHDANNLNKDSKRLLVSQTRTLKRHVPPADVRISDVEDWVKSSTWKLFSVTDGVRIFEHQAGVDSLTESSGKRSSVPLSPPGPPCMRINMTIGASPADVFTMVMLFPQSCCAGTVKSVRVVESLDNCTDIIHMSLEPLYVSPSWSAPRDMCLMRYWRHNNDGSLVVCLDSTVHHDCPLTNGHVRADLHAAYIIAPPKDGDAGEEESPECLLSFIAQMDPKGWIWRNFGFQHLFLRQFMLHLIDIRDSVDVDRFVQVHFDAAVVERTTTKMLSEEDAHAEESLGTVPPPQLDPNTYSDVDASTFRVRGHTYHIDKVKVSSGPSMFKLLCIDLFDLPEPTTNICAHPRNRVTLARERGEKTWVFAMNIMIPGPPFLSFVAYWEGDPTTFAHETPFGRVARKFFSTNDDEYRNNRFKLIPKVVDGNMVIKMAVKDTPTLMGNKLKVHYHKGENYFELDVDVGSSSIARNVVGLAIGYSKSIVVDMGLCLQGDEEEELPEVIMGGCTCIRIDCSKAKKL